MTFYNIKDYNDDSPENISKVSPNSKDTKTKIGKRTDLMDKETLVMLHKIIKELNGQGNDRNKLEWQIVSRILDRFLFLLNVISMILAIGYGYITLFTY